MSRYLIYVVGPSGAGKDSVLRALRASWCGEPGAHWARRTETRQSRDADEAHEGVSEVAFQRLLDRDAFAMVWQANGLRYGVRRTELAPLATGHCVFVNGSRAHVPEVLRQWPQSSVVHITAPLGVLRDRLMARQREDGMAVAERLARQVALDASADAIEIVNDGPLDRSVALLRAALQARLAPQVWGTA